MTLLTKFISINLTEIIFKNFLEKKYLTTFRKFLAFGAILAPNDPILTISPKITYFDQIDPINDTFDQIYVHKPD